MVKKKNKNKKKTHQLINLTKLSFLFYLCPKKNESQRSHPDIVWIYTYKENQNGVPTSWPRSPQLVTLEPLTSCTLYETFTLISGYLSFLLLLWPPFLTSHRFLCLLYTPELKWKTWIQFCSWQWGKSWLAKRWKGKLIKSSWNSRELNKRPHQHLLKTSK